jgi:hypothetical protein
MKMFDLVICDNKDRNFYSLGFITKVLNENLFLVHTFNDHRQGLWTKDYITEIKPR